MLKPLKPDELGIDYKQYKPGPFQAPVVSSSDGKIGWCLLVVLIVSILTVW